MPGSHELSQAFDEMGPIAVELRQVMQRLREAQERGTNREQEAALEYLRDDLLGQIRLRAERLDIDPMALRVLLMTEAKQRAKQRRRPSQRILGAALVKVRQEARAAAEQAKVDAERAMERAGSYEQRARAALEACRIYGVAAV